MPTGIEEPREIATLREIHHERVAVDVVSGIGVIEARQRHSLERRVPCLLVPIRHQAMAVWIQGRNQDDDNVVQDVERVRVARGGELIEQLGHGLAAADFGGMDARADRDDGRMGGGQAFSLARRQRPWIREPLVRCADLGEVRRVFRGADDRRDRAMACRRAAEIEDADAVARGGDPLEIPLDLHDGRDLAIRADRKTELRFRRGHLRRDSCAREGAHDGSDRCHPMEAADGVGSAGMPPRCGRARGHGVCRRATVAPRCAPVSSQNSITRGCRSSAA